MAHAKGEKMKQTIIIFFIIIVCNLTLHAQADSVRIVQHLETITKTDGYRNYENIPLLNKTAEYIFSVLVSIVVPFLIKIIRWKAQRIKT